MKYIAKFLLFQFIFQAIFGVQVNANDLVIDPEIEVLLQEIEVEESHSNTIPQENSDSYGEDDVGINTGETLPPSDSLIPLITVQSGLENIEGTELYTCKKESCKVNLTAVQSFNETFTESKFACMWDFGSGSYTTKNTDEKCNPGFVSYLPGKHSIILTVYEKENQENKKKSILDFENSFYSEEYPEYRDENIIASGSLTTDETATGVILTEETQTGSEESNTGSEISSGTFVFPEIVFEVQSGIEQIGTGSSYDCKKEDCKVNLTIEEIFTGAFIQDDYQCVWNFGSGSFTNGTEKKCNPGYISYGTGAHEILLELQEKTNTGNYITGGLTIYNTGSVLNKNSTEIETVIETESSEEIIESDFSNISITSILQQPSYVNGIGNTFECDRSKQECKVNFDFEILQNLQKSTSYICEVQIQSIGKSFESCNPSTVIFPLGKHTIEIVVLDKANKVVAYTESISVNNDGYIKSVSSVNATTIPKIVATKLQITSPQIVIQSGIDQNNMCKNKNCSVNLIYENKKGEKCRWSFPGGNFDRKTVEKCNPGYIKYSQAGEYNIELIVYDPNYASNFKSTQLDFRTFSKEKVSEKETTKNDEENTDFETSFIIELQGRKTDTKSYSGDTIICSVSPCNINLDGSKSTRSDGKKVSLNWELSTQSFSGNNPKAIWYEAGEYTLSILDGDNMKKIHLIVTDIPKQEKPKEPEILPEDFTIDPYVERYLKIFEINPNPKGVDNNEYIKLINTGDQDISLLGVIIDDMTDGGSKPYQIKEDIILAVGEILTLYKYQTKLNLNNDVDSINIFYDGLKIDSLSRDFVVPDNFLLNHKNTNIEARSVYVLRVIDGDTFEIRLENGSIERLRLVGVDTPEIYNTKNALEIQYGELAKKYTQSQLEGKTIYLELEENGIRDVYGRLLGYAIIDGENFNTSLIRLGYSRAYLSYSFKYESSFKKAETEAKKLKIGIWADANFKKLVNQEIKAEKVFIEQQKQQEEIKKKELFYIDINKDNIPDIFQDRITHSGTTDVSMEALKAYNDFVQNTFYIKIAKNKSGIKVSGKTLANAILLLSISGDKYQALSNESGEFSIILPSSLAAGKHGITTQLQDILGNSFEIEKEKTFELSQEYLDDLLSYEQEQRLKAYQKQQKKLAAELKKLKKKLAKSSGSGPKIYSSIFIKQTEAFGSNTQNNYTKHNIWLTLGIIISTLFLVFVLLRRKKLV